MLSPPTDTGHTVVHAGEKQPCSSTKHCKEKTEEREIYGVKGTVCPLNCHVWTFPSI